METEYTYREKELNNALKTMKTLFEIENRDFTGTDKTLRDIYLRAIDEIEIELKRLNES